MALARCGRERDGRNGFAQDSGIRLPRSQQGATSDRPGRYNPYPGTRGGRARTPARRRPMAEQPGPSPDPQSPPEPQPPPSEVPGTPPEFPIPPGPAPTQPPQA